MRLDGMRLDENNQSTASTSKHMYLSPADSRKIGSSTIRLCGWNGSIVRTPGSLDLHSLQKGFCNEDATSWFGLDFFTIPSSSWEESAGGRMPGGRMPGGTSRRSSPH